MKYYHLIPLACLTVVLSTSCVVTKGTSHPVVNKAIILQEQVIKDSLFAKIFNELEASKSINWSDGRTNKIKEKLSDYSSNTDWLLFKYKNNGGFSKDSVFLWRKYNPWSSTTAVTTTCVEKTKLNKWKLKRDEFSILNTLIHERAHTYCLNHGEDQTRATNQCDAVYIAGDLAEILILYRMGIKERIMNKPICPDLLKKVEEYHLLIIK